MRNPGDRLQQFHPREQKGPPRSIGLWVLHQSSHRFRPTVGQAECKCVHCGEPSGLQPRLCTEHRRYRQLHLPETWIAMRCQCGCYCGLHGWRDCCCLSNWTGSCRCFQFCAWAFQLRYYCSECDDYEQCECCCLHLR